MSKTIGIIGGMGPEATANLFLKIIKNTPVQKDQDHFRVIIDSNPKIPDRTAAIMGRGETPLLEMIKTGKNLDLLKVTVAGIPCITAHYYYDELQKALSYPVLNALEQLRIKITADYPEVKRIGILATTGTVSTGLFNRYLTGFTLVYPEKATQENKVMEAIYGPKGIKNGNLGDYPTQLLQEAGGELINLGADVLVAGCTEIPLVLKPEHFTVPLLDVLDILALALVKF